MKPEKPKKLWIFSTASLICFALFLMLSFLFFGTRAYHGAFEREPLSFSLVSDVSGEAVLTDHEAKPLPQGDHLLRLKNAEKENVSFSFYQSGKELAFLSLDGGEEKGIQLSSDGNPISVLTEKKGKSVAYLSDLESFRAISGKMQEGGDLIFIENVALETEKLNDSFRLIGDFSFRELSMESNGEKEIVICPDKSFKGTLYVSAPKCPIYWKQFQPTFSKDEWNYYLKAQSANDKRLLSSDFPISSYDQLSRLASEQIPYLTDGATLRFTNSIILEESLSFDGLVNLEFTQEFDFDGKTITFSSDQEGVFKVKTALGAGVDAASLLFDSPRSDLIWEGEGTIPASSTVEKGSNVKSYNGELLRLGGEGKAIPSLTLYADSDEYFTEDVVFQVQGNLLTATLPYLVSEYSLNEANFALSCEDGEATLDGSISNGVVVTKDLEGKERRFGIVALRDSNQIPVVHLETEGGAEITSKSQYVSATFALDGGTTEYDSLSETHIRIRGRGNSSWKWEKKPYKIHFDEPTSILGLPAAEEWALLSNYADKSLMRNRLAQVMASTLSFDYCPTQVCVDVFLNGEYLGVYTLGEHLEAGDGRVEIDYDMSRTDCGYFLEAGGVVSGVDVKGMNYFHAGLVKFVLIKTPEYNNLTSEQFEFIHQYMLKADEAVKKGEGYEEYLDVDSVIDWLIMIELTCNTDCSWRRSTYFTKEPGGKLVMGPVWDFDLAFGNFSKDNPGDDTWVSSEPDDDYVGETWSTYLLEDPEFQARFKARWLQVRDNLVNTAMEEIERQYKLNSVSAELNFKRWDILGKKVAFERHDTKNYRTYSSQIYYLQDYIENRAAWLDEQVSNF